jgi:quercetin dioxygenase-like cupin family protein
MAAPVFKSVPRGEGPRYELMGEVEIFKATAEDTGGAFSLFETISQPGGGAPLHIHHREDETVYVLEGRFLLQNGEDKFTAQAGDFAYFPKGIPHAYRNLEAMPGRLLFVMTPGGYERFFAEAAAAAANAPGDMGALMQVAHANGVEILGPPPEP